MSDDIDYDCLGDFIERNPIGVPRSKTNQVEQALEKRIQRLEAALREIAEHKHCDWFYEINLRHDNSCCGPVSKNDYCIGLIAGHRCAAQIAAEALKEVVETTAQLRS